MAGKVWKVVQWGIAAFMFLLGLVFILYPGGIVSGLLFIALGVLISPLRKKIFALLPEKFQSKIIAIVAGVVLTIGGFAAVPSTQTDAQLADSMEEQVSERSVVMEEADEEEIAEETEKVADENNIKSLAFSSDRDIELLEGKNNSSHYVKAMVNDKDSFSENDVTFVSADPEIATIEFSKTALSNYLYFTVTGVSAGETEVYAVSKDGTVESEHKKVTVKVDEEKLVKEKEEAEKKAAEEEKKAEEAKQAKEQAEVEKSKKAEAEQTNTTDTVAAAEAAAPVAEAAVAEAPTTETPSENEAVGGNGGGGNSDNFNKYDNPEQQQTEATYVLNTSTLKFHYPSCKDVKRISPENYGTSSASRDELIGQGYSACGHCKP